MEAKVSIQSKTFYYKGRLIMKKIIVLLSMTFMLMSCITPTVNQYELYGIVEDVVYLNGKYCMKVWCQEKGTYFKVKTNNYFHKGDIVRIR